MWREVPSGGRARGRLRVPPSKSVSHRYLNLALLAAATPKAAGEALRSVRVENLLRAEDTDLFLEALRRMGLEVVDQGSTVEIRGTPKSASGGPTEILCGNAGTFYRFLVATLCAVPGTWHVDGSPRLRQRPVGPLLAALRALGGRIRCLDREGYAPLEITGASLQGGSTRLDAGESSQYLSAVLQAAQLAREPVTVEVTALTSSPYLDLTLDAVAAFGGNVEEIGEETAGVGEASGTRTEPRTFRVEPSGLELPSDAPVVEGDFSAAAYPAAAAALTGGRVELLGLRRGSRQGDRRFLEILTLMGAQVVWRRQDGRGAGAGVEIQGPVDGALRGITADLSRMPDQVPTLAALAPFARGTTRIENVPHLRIKESDRLHAMATELGRLGAAVDELDDGLVLQGTWAEASPAENPVEVSTYRDHRIAMSLALVGLRRPGVRVLDPATVGKSYPSFWQDLEQLIER